MYIKYIPVKYNEYTGESIRRNTIIKCIDENTVSIDGELFEFDEASVAWDNISGITGGRIVDAKRVDGVLYLTVIRCYTGNCSSWDTGDYHEIIRENAGTGR